MDKWFQRRYNTGLVLCKISNNVDYVFINNGTEQYWNSSMDKDPKENNRLQNMNTILRHFLWNERWAYHLRWNLSWRNISIIALKYRLNKNTDNYHKVCRFNYELKKTPICDSEKAGKGQ